MKSKVGILIESEFQLNRSQDFIEINVSEINEETTLLHCLQLKKIKIDSSCGGFGTCGTCRFFLLKGSNLVDDLTEIEREWQRERAKPPHERLACQTYFNLSNSSSTENSLLQIKLSDSEQCSE